MKKMMIKNILLVMVLSSVAFTASAEWLLNNKLSNLNFISVKKETVAEVHSFKEIKGVLKETGNVMVTVSLNSVETNIPIRNDRMQQMLFDVVKFPKASVSTKVDFKRIKNMNVGDSYIELFELNLAIHGKVKEVGSEMRITRLKENKVLVSTIKPIIINLGDFSLIKGVSMLKEVAKLSSISTAVPVTAQLVFEK